MSGPQRRGTNRSRYDWSGVDWTLRDTDIAHRIGCSRQAVVLQRRRRGEADSPAKRKNARTLAALAFVTAHPAEAAGLPDDVLARRIGSAATAKTVKRARSAAGVRKARGGKFPWRLANWDLPNVALAEAWGVEPQMPAQQRYDKGLPAARWDMRGAGGARRAARDPAYRKALRAERAKAGRWRAASRSGPKGGIGDFTNRTAPRHGP